jgi:hypothetical protein
MNKIKDIIYNKSDILIAILILAIAALIIFWRLSIILEYPKEILGTDEASTVLTEPDEEAAAQTDADKEGAGEDANAGTDSQATTDADANKDAEAGQDANKDAAATDDQKADESKEAESSSSGEVTKEAKWDGDKLAADLEVKLTGTTAYEAVMCMVDAGIFKDYEEYQEICEKISYDHEKMRAGVFTFKKGTTKEDIIKEVNWS